MALTPEELDAIHEKWRRYTDEDVMRPASPVLRWCHEALLSAKGGEAALEIGVREGGSSAMFCEVALRVAPGNFRVLSVDPYGEMPMYSHGSANASRYGDSVYDVARSVLTPFPNSILYKMTDTEFLHRVLPTLTWWWTGHEHPASRRFLAFSFLDGPHEATAVVEEFCAVLRHTAPGGAIAIDNVESIPGVVEMLAKSARLGVVLKERGAPAGDAAIRALFTVPA